MFHVCLLLKEGKGVLGSEKHYPVRNISVVWCGQLLRADTVIDQVFVAAWVQRLESGDTATITSGHQQIEQLAPSPHHHKKLTPGTADPRLLLSRPGSCQYKDLLFCFAFRGLSELQLPRHSCHISTESKAVFWLLTDRISHVTSGQPPVLVITSKC